MEDPRLLDLLDAVIDNYITKGDPVGSKFLHSLETLDYAPSTLRKYLNLLEKAGLVYQPYNSSGRIPTIEGLSAYINHYIEDCECDLLDKSVEISNARIGLKYLIEVLGKMADGVVVGFLRNDEYYYLGINNILRDDLASDYETTRYIVNYIENKGIIKMLDGKMIKKNQVYYTFIQEKNAIMSCVYAKIVINDYDSIVSIIGPTRVNYKKNVDIIRKIITTIGV